MASFKRRDCRVVDGGIVFGLIEGCTVGGRIQSRICVYPFFSQIYPFLDDTLYIDTSRHVRPVSPPQTHVPIQDKRMEPFFQPRQEYPQATSLFPRCSKALKSLHRPSLRTRSRLPSEPRTQETSLPTLVIIRHRTQPPVHLRKRPTFVGHHFRQKVLRATKPFILTYF
jgi:hypothetical protein